MTGNFCPHGLGLGFRLASKQNFSSSLAKSSILNCLEKKQRQTSGRQNHNSGNLRGSRLCHRCRWSRNGGCCSCTQRGWCLVEHRFLIQIKLWKVGLWKIHGGSQRAVSLASNLVSTRLFRLFDLSKVAKQQMGHHCEASVICRDN